MPDPAYWMKLKSRTEWNLRTPGKTAPYRKLSKRKAGTFALKKLTKMLWTCVWQRAYWGTAWLETSFKVVTDSVVPACLFPLPSLLKCQCTEKDRQSGFWCFWSHDGYLEWRLENWLPGLCLCLSEERMWRIKRMRQSHGSCGLQKVLGFALWAQ